MESMTIESAAMSDEQILAQVFEKAGGQKAVAEKLALTKQAVNKWTRIPPAHVRVISGLTGIAMSRLRPDLYDPDYRAPAAPRVRRSASLARSRSRSRKRAR
jgi:DNA-binding transcriptional regulator YdaS (Cro superfamily)